MLAFGFRSGCFRLPLEPCRDVSPDSRSSAGDGPTVVAPVAVLRAGAATWLAAFVLLAAVLFAHSAHAEETARRIVYPRSESHDDARPGYPLAMLRLALERSGGRFTLVPSARPMQQSRSLALLETGDGLDIMWTVPTKARESALRPIRFPVDRGLIGWRLLLVRRGDVARFDAIRSPGELAALRGGQGHDWPDLTILRRNALRVEASPTYEGLFRMLVAGHVDYVPRSISEAKSELEGRAQLPIALEPALLLHYPSALYYFVNRDDERLAKAVERGLETSLRDGTLAREFEAHFGAAIAAARLGERRVLELENPLLSPETPLQREELWFRPDASL